MSTSGQPFPAPATLPPLARPRRSLPLGVAILAFLVGLYGFVVAVFGALVVVGYSIHQILDYLGPASAFGLQGVVYGIVVLIVGLIILGIGIALWRLRLWALVLGLLFLLFEMVTYVAAGRLVSVGFFLALLIFVYLLAVNRHFR